jgi:hypothetical protein
MSSTILAKPVQHLTTRRQSLRQIARLGGMVCGSGFGQISKQADQ